MGCSRVSKQTQDAQSLSIKSFHGTKKRCLFIHGFTSVGTECSRNAECVFLYKGIGCRIPNSVSPSLKCCTMTARRERRSIGFTLYKFLSAKGHDYTSVILRSNEAVVFFCSDSGKGLKPVGKVSGTFFDCPLLHCMCNLIGQINVKWLSVIQRLLKSLVGFLRQAFLHYTLIEHHASKQFRYISSRHLHYLRMIFMKTKKAM